MTTRQYLLVIYILIMNDSLLNMSTYSIHIQYLKRGNDVKKDHIISSALCEVRGSVSLVLRKRYIIAVNQYIFLVI